MESINPATEEPIGDYPEHTDRELDTKLSTSFSAFQNWRRTPVIERIKPLLNLSALLLARTETYARLITEEMGKVLREARAETEKSALTCRFYHEHGPEFLQDEMVATEATSSFVTYDAMGPVLAIMPWNFPFFQCFRFAVPALVAGNSVVIKHAPNVSRVAETLEQLFEEAGFPKGLLCSLRLSNERVAHTIRDSRIRAVTVCGSPAAGRAVAAVAGSVLKKTVLELGGSDAYLILQDADLDRAVEETVKSRLINAGQSCIGAKRCIVEAPIAEAFRQKLLERLANVRFGDPTLEQSGIGPLARKDLQVQLHRQIQRAKDFGARIELGGHLSNSKGYYYPVTVLDRVDERNPAFMEELFGPVFGLVEAKNEADGIRLANQSEYGLGASVFTSDFDKGIRIARNALEAGSCFVNSFVKSDPRLPFGGVKNSGYGRELSRHGLLEFVHPKSVWADRVTSTEELLQK